MMAKNIVMIMSKPLHLNSVISGSSWQAKDKILLPLSL